MEWIKILRHPPPFLASFLTSLILFPFASFSLFSASSYTICSSFGLLFSLLAPFFLLLVFSKLLSWLLLLSYPLPSASFSLFLDSSFICSIFDLWFLWVYCPASQEVLLATSIRLGSYEFWNWEENNCACRMYKIQVFARRFS